MILSLIIFLPLLFGVLILFVANNDISRFRKWAVLGSSLQLLLSVWLYWDFEPEFHATMGNLQWVEKLPWVNLNLGSFGRIQIEYFLGVDGLSIAFVPLTSFIMWIAVLASLSNDKFNKTYFALLMLLNTSIIGVFLALDFFLFFVFYELMLLPLYFLVGIWGGEKREYAAMKFFLYTLFGSVFMLLVMILLALSVTDPLTGYQTFNILHLINPNNYIDGSLLNPNATMQIFGLSARVLAFWALFVAFAIKIPVVPFHTWLPDAHVEAPTPVSIILAGIMLKVGGYGLLRIAFPLFPEVVHEFAFMLGLLGLISIIYGGLNALAMNDLKRMVAYSSVSHMGFVLIGLATITSEGVNGAIFQMISHGILSGMLFYLVGVLYDRVHNREIANFKGLATLMPRYTGMIMVAFFASLGMPGFSAFIGEIFTILGIFRSQNISHSLPIWMAVITPIGILLSAGYLLWTLQRMFFGNLYLKNPDWKHALRDLTVTEQSILAIFTIFAIIFGIYPALVFDYTNESVINWLNLFF